MPRYFFHLHDGDDLPDHFGSDLPDLPAAHRHAADLVIRQFAEDQSSGEPLRPWSLKVTDEKAKQLFTLKFKTDETDR